jgi:serine/threonine protein kinase
MGSVYQALDERLKRKVALKMINNLVQSNPRMVERFLREAQSVARLNHPNIITIYDVGEENNCPYIAMQLVEGGNLEITEPWPIPRAAELVEKLAKAMDYVHQHGIIHRDLKPSNIIMDQRGEPYILDFGLARFTEEGEQSVSIEGTVMGTPAFMAPEQARGDLDLVGPATDVYALGGILYVLLTGHHPFEGPIHALLYKVVNDNPPPLRTYRFDVPADLEKICLRCLEKDPSRRYASGADLADALRRCFLTPHLPNEEVKPDPVSSAASSGSENQLEKRTTAPLETSRPGFWRRLRSLFRF